MRLETQTGYLINETATVYGQSKYIGIHALAAVANSMAAAGASHPGVGVRIALPPYAYKSKIHTIEKNIKSGCREQEINRRIPCALYLQQFKFLLAAGN